MRTNIVLICIIAVIQLLLFQLKYMPWDWAQHWYNDMRYDQGNAISWFITAILIRRLTNLPSANLPVKIQRRIRIFKVLANMCIWLIGGLVVNEFSGTADLPKWWVEHTVWGFLVILYTFTIITIHCVKIYKLGRLAT